MDGPHSNAASQHAYLTAYHITQGPVRMAAMDARDAVNRFPHEWSFAPWSREYERPSDMSEDVARVPIPETWANLPPDDKRSIVKRLGAADGLTDVQVDETLRAEVIRRNALSDQIEAARQ